MYNKLKSKYLLIVFVSILITVSMSPIVTSITVSNQEILLNDAPSIPEINGPNHGPIGMELEWTFVSTDPEGDNITYYIDFGDSCGGAKYHGPYPSGEEITVAHKYTYESNFIIAALAIDSEGGESDWGYFEVSIPRNRVILSFLQIIFEKFPRAFPLLRYLTGY